jgi:hypothetical protein
MATDIGSGDLGHLDPVIDKVEFKLTVLPADEPKVQTLLAEARAVPEWRKVYFYDTRALALDAHHVILRSRVVQGDDDSTVKLRPAELSGDDAGWRRLDGIRTELDVVGSRQVVSAKVEGEPDPGEIEDVEAKRRPVASLFKAEQEALVKAYASDVPWDALEVLGPVDARKWTLGDLRGFPYELCVEQWLLPDASHFIELSFKVDPDDADDAQSAFGSLLVDHEIDATGDQEPKTPRVLRFFADRLKDDR